MLIDQFAIEDVVVANRIDGQSTFKRMIRDVFIAWLEDYSVGELWIKTSSRGEQPMSNYTEVVVLVEGATGQCFIKELLTPIILYKSGETWSDVKFARDKNDIGKHLKQRRNTYVTLMVYSLRFIRS